MFSSRHIPAAAPVKTPESILCSGRPVHSAILPLQQSSEMKRRYSLLVFLHSFPHTGWKIMHHFPYRQNVGTALAVYEAVMKNKPLIERVVTVTGKSVKNPGNFLCRIGTPISKLIEAAGGMPEDTAKVIGGGPMMGRTMVNIDSPVMKGTSGVLLINEKEAARRPMRNCIRCGKCVSACPMGLEPYLLMKLSQFNLLERMEEEKVMDCIECGSCSFTCPSDRPLLDYIRLGKARTGAMIRSRKK